MTALLSFLSGCFFTLGSVAFGFSFFSPTKDEEDEQIPHQHFRGRDGLYDHHLN